MEAPTFYFYVIPISFYIVGTVCHLLCSYALFSWNRKLMRKDLVARELSLWSVIRQLQKAIFAKRASELNLDPDIITERDNSCAIIVPDDPRNHTYEEPIGGVYEDRLREIVVQSPQFINRRNTCIDEDGNVSCCTRGLCRHNSDSSPTTV